jgi:hypothetical protein
VCLIKTRGRKGTVLGRTVVYLFVLMFIILGRRCVSGVSLLSSIVRDIDYTFHVEQSRLFSVKFWVSLKWFHMERDPRPKAGPICDHRLTDRSLSSCDSA